MTKDEALKLALEAFGEIDWSNNSQWQSDRAKVAIATLKEALAQPEQHQDWCASLTQMLMSMPPKPAPCNCKPKPEQPKVRTGNCLRVGVCASEGHKIAPQRTWVGLTDKEIDELWMSHHDDFGNALSAIDYERAIEAKLKEKNETN